MVENNKNGYIVEKKCAKGIAEKIEELYNREDLRMNMGIASRIMYIENFTENLYIENIKNIFSEAA